MVTNFPNINPTLAKLVDAIVSSIPFRTGQFPTAPPNTFKDRLGNPIPLTTDEVEVELRVNPGGAAMAAKVRALNSGTDAIEGVLDIPTLLAALQSDLSVSSGTATLVAGSGANPDSVVVTVPNTSEGNVPVPVGSIVLATVQTPGGNPKLLSAVRTSDTTITISSPGSGYAALLESAGVQGTCASGTVSVTLNNVVGDRLSVEEVTPGGSAADHFSVGRVDATHVAVFAQNNAGAFVSGNTSVVKVYNFGQPAHETSTVQWAVIRPS